MEMKLARAAGIASILAMAVMLGGCSGGGGGGLASTPAPSPSPAPAPSPTPAPSSTPTPAPSPAPSPTPPPAPAPTSFPLGGSLSFDTILASRTHTVDPDRDDYEVQAMSASGRGQEVRIRYDDVNKTYSLSDAINAATFGPSDRTATGGHMQNFEKQSGFVTDLLEIYGNLDLDESSAGGSGLELEYLSYGLWVHKDAVLEETQSHYFLFGFPTGGRMPTTGTAAYSAEVSAYLVDADDDDEGRFGGSALLTADFGAGTVSTDLTLTTLSGILANFQGSGSIYGTDQFGGNFSTSSSRHFQSGSFFGGFYGPGAAEAGYAFWLRMYPTGHFTGVSEFDLDAWIIGAAVGKKD